MDADGRAVLGNRITENQPLGKPIALTVSRSPARIRLRLLHTLQLDESGRFLATSKSTYILILSDTLSIVTYDYSRDPSNEYPKAHIHLHGNSAAIESLLKVCGRASNNPDDLHFPVGGTRYRPCAEDLIEFCIVERLVKPRPSWKQALNTARERYRDIQLRAATRRSPSAAASTLRSLGWYVSQPQDDA